MRSVREQTLSIGSWTQIHSFIHIKSGGSSSIDKEIYLRREQGGVGKLAKPWVKTKAAGNEKRSEAANHPAFLTNGYQRVTGSKVRPLWMASPAACHEERVEPPACDPESRRFHQESPRTHLGLIPPRQPGIMSRTDGRRLSCLFVIY